MDNFSAYDVWQEELTKTQKEDLREEMAKEVKADPRYDLSLLVDPLSKVLDRMVESRVDMEKRILDTESKMLEVSEQRAQEKAAELFDRYKEGLSKSGTELAKAKEDAEAKSLFFDPFQLMENLGYKERVMSMSYDTLRLMSERNPIIAAIINTRIHQVTSFSRPPKTKHDIGFEITMRDDEQRPSKSDLTKIKELEDTVEATGVPDIVEEESRDSFETYLSKEVRDSLTYDQACWEVVPGRGGLPVAFYAIDSATIRFATTPKLLKMVGGYGNMQMEQIWKREMDSQQSQTAEKRRPKPEDVRYVQVISGKVMNTYSEQEMAFGVRNPRTYIQQNKYGVSELELLVQVITSHLWAEQYNQKFFSSGAAPKGIIHFEGQNLPQEQLLAFRRQWHAQVSGVWNAWRTPIIASPGKLVYTNLQMSNRQMEFSNWIEYLIKLMCACYLMDPSEINFDLRGTSGQQAPMFESPSEAKLKMSRDRGLKPLLRFFESEINKNFIFQIDKKYELQFVGLDSKSEKDVVELQVKELEKYKVVDEVRAENDLKPLGEDKGGDLIMDSAYINYRTQMKMQAGMGGGFGGPEPGAPSPGFPKGEEEELDFGKEEEEPKVGVKLAAKEKEETETEGGGRLSELDRMIADMKGLKKSFGDKDLISDHEWKLVKSKSPGGNLNKMRS
ncbi:hypothetical protein A2Z67_02795 [Candidatus Woesebacteria bacterium RBG_13_36_22]|uniref:Portal protein n=1 Tax=Candidatus Woesebacteria bacterium RBG_13_36_22 TaxID=1802478 RepID=A0A1F7X5Z1_9BACT|nr:MAG: hypothetical protein A2Z67_02795 [Candidatus Woesebacteria bacterium RBG_13_36_22]